MPSSIRWPDKYSPERTSVHAHNELDMMAYPESVWAWLVRADLWPTWYSNSKDVVIEGGGHELKLGTKFRWKTFGASLRSTVEEFALFERLAWSAKGTGIDVYHAWLIEKTSAGCHVLTEENQNGLIARLSNSLRPGNMERYHQIWLENLLMKAKSGTPPLPQM
jgi:hypothetical protein